MAEPQACSDEVWPKPAGEKSKIKNRFLGDFTGKFDAPSQAGLT